MGHPISYLTKQMYFSFKWFKILIETGKRNKNNIGVQNLLTPDVIRIGALNKAHGVIPCKNLMLAADPMK